MSNVIDKGAEWIRHARELAEKLDQDIVVMVTIGGRTGETIATATTRVTTYGRRMEDAEKAAELGNFIKKCLGWPDELCHDEPALREPGDPRG